MVKKRATKKRVSKATKKKTPRKKTARKKTTREHGGINKSQAIRDYVAKHPSEGPTAISKALVAEGIAVTPAFVSVVKNKAGSSTGRGRRSGRPSRSVTPTVEHLKAAKRFADKVGGIPTARAALDALAEVMH